MNRQTLTDIGFLPEPNYRIPPVLHPDILDALYDQININATRLTTEQLKNRIYGLDALHYLELYPSNSVDMIFTDEPYGQPGHTFYYNNQSGKKAKKPIIRNFDWDEKLPAHLAMPWVYEAARVLKDGGALINCGLPTWSSTYQQVIEDSGLTWRAHIAWIKCLSGGTQVYARTQKGDMPTTINSLARLDPRTVKLWNGEKWTQVLGWSRATRNSDELEITLRSGERISCTPTHRFPTKRGLLSASELQVGDVLESVRLPEPEEPYSPSIVPCEAAWFIGLYLAEGSRVDDTIQISGHVKEIDRLEKVKKIAEFYGGSVTCTNKGNSQNIRIYGRFLNALIDQYISGKTAKNKGLKVRCWSHSNEWLRSLLDGYLSGDGHFDEKSNRWRLGFTRNYKLERNLRTLCARLGLPLTLNLARSTYNGSSTPIFRGELRFEQSEHYNNKSKTEIVEIKKSRCREVYDIAVEDEPHLFALASGVLTHNSNPMRQIHPGSWRSGLEMMWIASKGTLKDRMKGKVPQELRVNWHIETICPNCGESHNVIDKSNYKLIYQGYSELGGLEPGRIPTHLEPFRSGSVRCHDTHKPEWMATYYTDLLTSPGDIVIDPFAGSGELVLAAAKSGRFWGANDRKQVNQDNIKLRINSIQKGILL